MPRVPCSQMSCGSTCEGRQVTADEDDVRAAAVALVARTRAAQGLAPRVTDTAVLGTIAEVLTSARTNGARTSARHQRPTSGTRR
jgi:hypothetical protein